jgi:hypothetical protein
MKAAILTAADSVPVYGDFDDPVAGEASEIVELVAAGIHPLTRLVATGRHYSRGAAFPLIPGLNAVARTAGGELVFTSSGEPPYGTSAERIASPGAMRFPLPPGAPPEAVAAGVNPGMASWLPLKARQAEAGRLGTVRVLGVTGMSGFLAAQNARLLGAARVVGAGRSQPGLHRAAAAGADTVPLTGDRDADAEALAKTLDGDTPGLVLDFLWGPVAETAFAALNPKAAPPGPSAAPPGPSTVPPGSSAAPPGPSAAPPRPSPAPPGPAPGQRRYQIRSDRRARRGAGRRPVLAAGQPEAHYLRQRGRFRLRSRHQRPDPGLYQADCRGVGPGPVPYLFAVRRRRGLDRLGPSRAPRGHRPEMSR